MARGLLFFAFVRTRDSWDLVKATFSEWVDDKASRLAAALAYYTAFSLAPLLVIAIGVAGLVFGDEAAQGRIVGELQSLMGPDGARFVEELIAASRRPASGITATVVGVVILLFGATGVFGELQDALNTIWGVKPGPSRQGLRGILKDRLLSFTMVLGTGFLLLVSLALSAAFAVIGSRVGGLLPFPEAALQLVNFLVSLGFITLLFALIFKVVPDAKIAWRDVWIGALITALLFSLGKLVIGLYLGKSTVTSSFGAAASLAVMLIWIYYSAQILFIGAEFTQVYATRFGSRIRPARGAVALTDEDRAQQGIARDPAPPEPEPDESPDAPRSAAR
ncbi:MAG TPA: YihY/virulence factor BrkB family protein [Kofleriaceae bacterium]|nr:YihY/virulence factor BrkB family protein [Kofleriaceae bacterium]